MERLRKILILCALACFLYLPAGKACFLFAEEVQGAAVAGYFYPKDKASLESVVEKYIKDTEDVPIEGDIFAIIVPHAGYEYSGQVAAWGFRKASAKKFKTAIVIAPSHRFSGQGLFILNKDSYLTPLGKIPIDKELTTRFLKYDKKIQGLSQPFMQEHAAEVELPFLQAISRDFKVVILLTGEPSYDTAMLLRDALTSVLKGRDDVLIVVSTDMSHYHPQNIAQAMDRRVISDLEGFDSEALFAKLSTGECELCGGAGVVGVLMACRNLGADSVKVLKYATSADVTGDKSAVVGYFSACVYKTSGVKNQQNIKEEQEMKGMLTVKQKKRLLEIARQTIEAYIGERRRLDVTEADPVLNEHMGAFVTLHENGQLRGCIGNIIGRGPLYLTVRDMAIAASTEDPRFSPVRKDELGKIDIEISVLSPMEKIDDPDKIIMGKHGVMVQSGFRGGVYLPQVATETGWSRDEFMDSLCLQKAGMAADSWRKKGGCDIYIFTAEVFGEKDLKK